TRCCLSTRHLLVQAPHAQILHRPAARYSRKRLLKHNLGHERGLVSHLPVTRRSPLRKLVEHLVSLLQHARAFATVSPMAYLASWIRESDEADFLRFFSPHAGLTFHNARREAVDLEEIDGLL